MATVTTESANVARSIAFVAVNIAWRLELATIRAERPRDKAERAARRLAERAAADTMCNRMAAVRADYWEAVAVASRAAILRRSNPATASQRADIARRADDLRRYAAA